MSRGEFAGIKEEQEAVAKELSMLMNRSIDDAEVQAIVARHHATNEKFYKTNASVYKGLAHMYINDARFTQFYDRYKVGLSKFLREAMYFYAEQVLEKSE